MEIKNKVAESGIQTVDLQTFLPVKEIVVFDIKDHLFMEMILKEKDFREALKNQSWEVYTDKNVGVACSADAIIPRWAYMLVISYLQPVANFVAVGNATEIRKRLLLKAINEIDTEDFTGARVVIKGCGDSQINDEAYGEITRVLLPVVKSIMYGEPCSTVPVFKRRNL